MDESPVPFRSYCRGSGKGISRIFQDHCDLMEDVAPLLQYMHPVKMSG